MDARDICRRLNCSPITLAAWVERGCPIHRRPPYAHFVLEEVEAWLAAQQITDWPTERDAELDVPLRVLLRAVQRHRLTPGEAERVMTMLGSGIWG